MKNRSHRYKMNRPRSRHENKSVKYNKCHSMAMLMICIKQHLSNIMKKLSNTEADFKKSVAYKKSVYFIFISSEIIRKLIHYKQTTCISH